MKESGKRKKSVDPVLCFYPESKYGFEMQAGLLTYSLFESLPIPKGQWREISKSNTEFTAAGTVQDSSGITGTT